MTDPITIGFTGDIMLGRTLDYVVRQQGYNYPWGDLLALMRQTDMNVINLETTLTNSTDRLEKTFNFKATPDKIKSLVSAKVTVANLANNHIMDFGIEGMLETIRTLDEAKISHVGAGRNLREAKSAVIVTRKNIRVGMAGFTDNEAVWKANNTPGINYVDFNDRQDHADIFQSLNELRKQSDIIILSIHWGPNMREAPPQHFIDFAHRASELGAHVIHGHSAHILQGIEVYNGSLILYDTGDFVDDYMVDADLRNDLSAFFVVTTEKSGLRNLLMVPTKISNYQVNRAIGREQHWVISRMQKLSSALGTVVPDDGNIDMMSTLKKNTDQDLRPPD